MGDKKYCIGKVEEICKIGKKTLRFYDQIGLLSPSEINENGYRYYDEENLYTIPVIKYYKQSGFTLDEIKALIYSSGFSTIEEGFDDKIKELQLMEEELNLKKKSIKDWYSLVREARMIIEYNIQDVKIKFLEEDELLFLEQEYNYDYVKSIINIEFTNYIEKIENAITGPVIIEFPSFSEKLEKKCNKVRILQKNLKKCSSERLTKYGGYMVASAYHIGSHKTIDKTYKKIKEWLKYHNYKYDGRCFERYVIDYWSTKDEEKYVTEIIVKLKM